MQLDAIILSYLFNIPIRAFIIAFVRVVHGDDGRTALWSRVKPDRTEIRPASKSKHISSCLRRVKILFTTVFYSDTTYARRSRLVTTDGSFNNRKELKSAS